MDRRTFSLSAIGALVGTLTACGGGGGGGSDTQQTSDVLARGKDTSTLVQPPEPSAELASPTSLPKGTMFLQTVAATDGDPEAEAAPGQANFWDLRTNLALGDGYNNQFSGALNLSVSLGGAALPFPADQTHAGLTAYGPELDAGDGVKTVTFVAAGNTHLHPVRGARLQQTLDLTNAAGSITLTWVSNFSAADFVNHAGSFEDEPFSWKVVLLDSAGNWLKTFFSYDQTDAAKARPGFGTDGRGDLSAYAGRTVVLSFEHDSPAYGSQVSCVSVTDSSATPVQYVINGDFTAGARGWTVPAVKVSQNVQSAPRPLHGLEVRRMFYTQPDALWGRWTDCFHNPTMQAINVTVSYDSTLGSGGRGVIYDTPGANGRALTSWDGSDGTEDGTRDRDIGMVFGSGVTKTAQTATALASADGSANIIFTHTISVPAFGSVALVNFIIMTGKDTGLTATSTSAQANEVDTLAADIANNFRSNFAYQRGMMQAQLDTLKNF